MHNLLILYFFFYRFYGFFHDKTSTLGQYRRVCVYVLKMYNSCRCTFPKQQNNYNYLIASGCEMILMERNYNITQLIHIVLYLYKA